jgi:hypothetical protein
LSRKTRNLELETQNLDSGSRPSGSIRRRLDIERAPAYVSSRTTSPTFSVIKRNVVIADSVAIGIALSAAFEVSADGQ